ncbi:MAG: hypothetical protein Q7T36_08290 [Fluviicoccus sp.]|uniref:HvfA family oxazolone/thioamide-modified RiPP metallophore n=1 Tax=Fluviicoccus sp. TaxID=2003552 RepID=UPI002725ED2D|nr:hypothetical protein [Fluviicoccus sp.]MDO8330452.1 hypothetical protein [Fluviicoccus sp.]
MKLSSMTPIAAALAMSMSSTVLAESAAAPTVPFSGAAKAADEGKCCASKMHDAGKEGKCGAGKMGNMKAAEHEGKCGAEKMKAAGNEGSCGAKMKGMVEAKPGDAALKGEVMAPIGNVKAVKKADKEGKCGEGKCGAKKMKALKDAPASPVAVPAK